MPDYGTQVKQQRDRITRMLDRGPTLGEVGRAGLSSVGRGRRFAEQLETQRQSALTPEMMKLDLLTGAAETEVEQEQFEGKQKLQRKRIALEERRANQGDARLAFDYAKAAADQGNKEAQEVLKVFSELTEGASVESASKLWREMYEGDTEITAQNARKEIGKLASGVLKQKETTRMFQSGEEQFEYTKRVEDYKRRVKQDDKVRDNAETAFSAAQDTLFQTDRMLQLMENNPDLTGAGEELFTVGKNIVNAFMRFTGDTQPFDISSQQEFKAYAIKGALDLKEKLPGQISNFEVQTMLDAAAKLDKSREANLNLLYAMRAVAERVVDYNNKLIEWERDPANAGQPLRHFNQNYQRWAADNPIVAKRAESIRTPRGGPQQVGQDAGKALYDTFKALPDDQEAVNQWYLGLTDAEQAALQAYRTQKRGK